MLQNVQVGPPGDLGRVFVPQPVISHAKTAVGEQVFAIAIVLKGAGLAHQLVDDVPIIDGMLVASHQPRQSVDLGSREPDFHTVGIQSGFDFPAH